MEDINIPPTSQRRIISLSRQTLENFVLKRNAGQEPSSDPHLRSTAHGAFVSLHKADELRGCIGTCFPTRPLGEIIIEMTQAAASRDHRVAPVGADELPEIAIEVSVLSRPETVDHPLSLQAGRHGLYISSGERRGVLLPQVATQYGWDIETFLGQTCSKAGLPRNAWKWPETTVMGFTALIIEEKK